ncbi:hypothetical protein [Leucobacter sp. BZR 635]
MAHATLARRQALLWVSTTLLTGFAALLALISPASPQDGGISELAFAGQIIGMFAGIAYSAAFTDYFTAHGRAGIAELESSTPVRAGLLRASRLIGTLSVALFPSLCVLLIWGGVQTVNGRPAAMLGALAVALTVVLPSGLTAIAISACCGALLPRGIARVPAVLLWLWVCFSSPLIPVPVLNGTFFTLVGDQVVAGLFLAQPIYETLGPLAADPTALSALLSLLWQFGVVALLLASASAITDLRRRR